MKGLISVIVPVYNAQEYIRRCVDSIAGQSYEDLEIILVDDGSKDDSPELCDAFSRKDSRIRVIHQSNGGVSLARNNAIEASRGEWIAFCDNDDYMHPRMLETLLSMCLENDCDVACSRPEKGAEESFTAEPVLPLRDVKVFTSEQMLSNIYGLSSCFVWDKLYRREIFDHVRFPVGSYTGEDIAVLHRVFHAARRIAVTDARLYYHFIHDRSVMHRGFDVRWANMLDAMKERIDFAASNTLMPLHDQSVRRMVYTLGYLLFMNGHYNSDDVSRREFSAAYGRMQKEYYRKAAGLSSTGMKDRIFLWADVYATFCYHLYNFVKWRILRGNKEAVWGSIH